MAKISAEKAREYQQRYKAKHPEKVKEMNRAWIAKNRQRYNESKSEYRFKLKIAAIDYYSGGKRCCNICGFNSDLDALCLDHIPDIEPLLEWADRDERDTAASPAEAD